MKKNSTMARNVSASEWLNYGLVFFLVSSLAGCTTESTYKEPTGASTATIEFINEARNSVVVDFYADSKECTNRKSAGHLEPNVHRQIVVPAGQNIALSVSMRFHPELQQALLDIGGFLGALLAATSDQGCIEILDFTPESGKAYALRFASDGRACEYDIYEQQVKPYQLGGHAPVEFTVRERVRAFDESGPFCKKR